MADFSDRCHLSNWEGWDILEQMLKENEQERRNMPDQEFVERANQRISRLNEEAERRRQERGLPPEGKYQILAEMAEETPSSDDEE